MKIYCDCGEPHSIKKEMAGSQLTCRCGSIVTVPNLSRLRELSPEVQLPAKFSDPVYWIQHGCFTCGGRDTSEALLVIQCEPEVHAVVPGKVHPASFLSILLLPFFGVFGTFGSKAVRVKIQDEKILSLPIALCSQRSQLKDLQVRCGNRLHQDDGGAELIQDYPELKLRVALRNNRGVWAFSKDS